MNTQTGLNLSIGQRVRHQPFDDRDEVIAELRAALQAMLDYHDDVAKAADQRLLDAGYAALAKAGGSK